MLNNIMWKFIRNFLLTREFLSKLSVHIMLILGLGWLSFTVYYYYTGQVDSFFGALAGSLVFFVSTLIAQLYNYIQCSKAKASSSLSWQPLLNIVSQPMLESIWEKSKKIVQDKRFLSVVTIGVLASAVGFLSYNLISHKDK